MSRPALEVADILRAYAGRFLERSRARVSWPQHKVMRAIERCRTALLGKHRDQCTSRKAKPEKLPLLRSCHRW